MHKLKHWFVLGIRIVLWVHVVFILLALLFSLLYSILPPGISTLHVYRRWVDGIKPRYPVRFVALEKLNPNLTEMLIAAEDGNFPVHRGIDIESMKQAWQINRQLGYYAAGEYLTQQLARPSFCFRKNGWCASMPRSAGTQHGTGHAQKAHCGTLRQCCRMGAGHLRDRCGGPTLVQKPATALGVDELARLVAILPSPLDYTPHSFWRHPIFVGVGNIFGSVSAIIGSAQGTRPDCWTGPDGTPSVNRSNRGSLTKRKR